jgi:hypothetical protein
MGKPNQPSQAKPSQAQASYIVKPLRQFDHEQCMRVLNLPFPPFAIMYQKQSMKRKHERNDRK